MACFIGAGFVANAAFAEAAFAETSRSPEAESAFRRGVDLAKDGKTCEAASAFEESHRLSPARDTLNGLALAEEECGKVASAYRHFASLLEQATASGDDRRARLARKALERLAPQLARLVIRAPEGAIVTIDGEPSVNAGEETVIEPGRHVVRAEADGRVSEKIVQLEPGQSARAELAFTDDATPRFDVGVLEAVGIAVAGVGVIGLVSGTVLFASAGSTFDEVEAQCNDRVCPASAAPLIESGEREEIAGQALIGIGITFIAAGAGILTWRLLEQDDAAVALRVGPTSFAVGGQF